MRLIRISLAAKYRILFGLAVLLIIGAALYVPWYRMRMLTLEQPFREAQRIADDYFRLVMPEPGAVAGAAGGIHAKDFSLLPEQSRRPPRFVRLNPDPNDSSSFLNPDNLDPLVAKAFMNFVRNPKRGDSMYVTRSDAEGRWFSYAHAVRVTKRCLNCHDEGKSARPYRENELAGIITVDLPADFGDQQAVWNRLAIIAAGALAGILAILVFYVITHRFILSPIHELREVAMRVTEGDLDVRPQLKTGDEFEHLSDSLNAMLERLRASQEELKKANRSLDQKLGEMAETNVALFESNRLKTEFLANVSHELRTPLTSIIGFAELLREGPQSESNGRTARYAENILISGRILLEIINDLLDLAKIEAGKVELSLESVPLGELCAGLLDFVRPMADAKTLRLELEAPADPPVIVTDRGRLRQILFNFLSNAIKFTPQNGLVMLRVEPLGGRQVQVSVCDNGPGIAPAHQAMIFEKFRQIDQSATREHHGTGLGLAIAKELTQLLGGEIGVNSQAGQGATFWVRLPESVGAARARTPVSLV